MVALKPQEGPQLVQKEAMIHLDVAGVGSRSARSRLRYQQRRAEHSRKGQW